MNMCTFPARQAPALLKHVADAFTDVYTVHVYMQGSSIPWYMYAGIVLYYKVIEMFSFMLYITGSSDAHIMINTSSYMYCIIYIIM